MPRMQRLESTGSLAHIMARGIDGKDIFLADEDRSQFLGRLAGCLADVGHRCLAWCLMDNHYHLLVRTNEKPMSKLMRPLNSGYSRWFNDKYGRRGYLFQDRFRSTLCQDLGYARELVRYIHLNPIRGGLVRSLDGLRTWRWCGHGFLLGARGATGAAFQDRREILRRFGRTEHQAVQGYLRFLAEGIGATNPEEAGRLSEVEDFEVAGAHKGWPTVIGDPDFVRQAMERHAVGVRRRHRQADYVHVLKSVANEVCARYQLRPEELLSRGRGNARSEARALFCYRIHDEERIPLSAVARYLRITIPPAFMLAKRGKSIGGASS